MATRVEVHPTAIVAAKALVVGLAVVVAIMGLRRLGRSSDADASNSVASSSRFVAEELLLPIIELRVGDASMEVNWSQALAAVLSGKTEARVEGGRVDVLTPKYAIEVDRLEKWHEAIGQAAHYSGVTGQIAVAAIIVPSDSWPLSDATRERLLLIDRTCLERGVKVILLRRARLD